LLGNPNDQLPPDPQASEVIQVSLHKWTAEVRARLEAATPGPWTADEHGVTGPGSKGRYTKAKIMSDNQFIANAPADLTKALAVIEILRESLQTVSVFQTESQSAEIARQAIAKADEVTK